MKKTFLSLIVSALLMPLTASAQTDAQYDAAVTNITEGNYRIYAEVGGTKYYLKADSKVADNSFPSKKAGNAAAAATTAATEATVYTIAQENASGLKAKRWAIGYHDVYFTNPEGGSNSEATFTQNGVLYGYKGRASNNLNYDRQVLFYDGTAYAIRSTNVNGTSWGASAYWGIVSGNADYVAEASYVWHFEAVAAATDITTGKYLIKGANTSWAGNTSEPYWINNNKDMFCLWNDVTQATTFDVVKAGDELYFYDSAKKKWLMHYGSAWLSTPNAAAAFYAQKHTYNGDEYFALATEAYAVFGTNSKFCTAETSSSSHSRTADGYSYSFSGFGCVDGTGKTGDDVNPDALWSFVEAGSSASTTFDLTTLRTGVPGLVAALKTAATGNVSYTLTVTEAGWATLCLPYAAEIPAGVTAVYTLAFDGSLLKATAVETTLPANTPVLVKAAAGTYAFSAACSTIAEAVATPASGALTGTFAYNGSLASAYILQYKDSKPGFYQISDTHAIGAFRAYIPTSAVPSASAPSFTIDFGETTGIENAAKREEIKDKGYFDLQGRRVQQPTRGLYIVNGKKVLVNK